MKRIVLIMSLVILSGCNDDESAKDLIPQVGYVKEISECPTEGTAAVKCHKRVNEKYGRISSK